MRTCQKNWKRPGLLNWMSILSVVLLVGLSACATIQPHTVQLSSEVGNRITEMEQLHQLALQRYFDSEREKIENFLTNEWEPLFLRNFIGTSGIIQMLNNTSRIGEHEKGLLETALLDYIDAEQAAIASNQLVAELDNVRKSEPTKVRQVLGSFLDPDQVDKVAVHLSAILASEEPATLILEFAAAAHEEMSLQRQKMLSPLEQARAEATAALSSSYAELIKGQSTLTARLEAASKLNEEQGKVLSLLGVNNKANGILSKLTDLSTRIDHSLQIASDGLNIGEDAQGDVAGALIASLNGHISNLFGGAKEAPVKE